MTPATGLGEQLASTALLGTARRPLPAELPGPLAAVPPAATSPDPAVRLLELAAGYSLATRAGRRLARLDPGGASPAPVPDRPAAPSRARRVLDDLLAQPRAELVNLWLAACVDARFALAPEHWTPLAVLAARSTAYDRPLLGRALGPPGRWFLEQTPAWRRLAEGARTAPGPARPDAAGSRVVTPETVRREPEAVFTAPTPWPADLIEAALGVLVDGRLGRTGRAYAADLGTRLPLTAYPGLARAAEHAVWHRPAPLAERRLVRECFVACEQALWARIEISHAFAAGSEPLPARLPVPPLNP